MPCAYDIQYIWCRQYRNHREDKFLRATKHQHYENAAADSKVFNKASKSRKCFKAFSLAIAVTLSAAALIVPTTTLAPGVDAYSDSKVASYSVGDIDKFSAVITNNCVEETTVPVTEPSKAVKETQTSKTAKSDKTSAASKAKTEKSEAKKT